MRVNGFHRYYKRDEGSDLKGFLFTVRLIFLYCTSTLLDGQSPNTQSHWRIIISGTVDTEVRTPVTSKLMKIYIYIWCDSVLKWLSLLITPFSTPHIPLRVINSKGKKTFGVWRKILFWIIKIFPPLISSILLLSHSFSSTLSLSPQLFPTLLLSHPFSPSPFVPPLPILPSCSQWTCAIWGMGYSWIICCVTSLSVLLIQQ